MRKLNPADVLANKVAELGINPNEYQQSIHNWAAKLLPWQKERLTGPIPEYAPENGLSPAMYLSMLQRGPDNFHYLENDMQQYLLRRKANTKFLEENYPVWFGANGLAGFPTMADVKAAFAANILKAYEFQKGGFVLDSAVTTPYAHPVIIDLVKKLEEALSASAAMFKLVSFVRDKGFQDSLVEFGYVAAPESAHVNGATAIDIAFSPDAFAKFKQVLNNELRAKILKQVAENGKPPTVMQMLALSKSSEAKALLEAVQILHKHFPLEGNEQAIGLDETGMVGIKVDEDGNGIYLLDTPYNPRWHLEGIV